MLPGCPGLILVIQTQTGASWQTHWLPSSFPAPALAVCPEQSPTPTQSLEHLFTQCGEG